MDPAHRERFLQDLLQDLLQERSGLQVVLHSILVGDSVRVPILSEIRDQADQFHQNLA